MVIGILQFDLHIHDAQSLKDKRRVVSSIKDRLHREHLVAIAEISSLDNPSLARLGLAAVGNDGRRVGQTLDTILHKLRALHDAELGDVSRELLHNHPSDAPAEADDEPHNQPDSPSALPAVKAERSPLDLDALSRELLARGEAAAAEAATAQVKPRTSQERAR